MSMMPYWRHFEQPFRMMEREMFHPESIAPFHQLMPRGFFAPDFFKPWEDMIRPWENHMKQFEEMSNAMNRLALNELQKGTSITADDEKFQVNVDVQHFAPEEVNVKVVDRHVIIEGKHEEKKDEHGYVSRQFVRRYALPEGCLPDTVESKLSSDGVLTVTAPKVLPLPSIGERIVPITKTGPVKKMIGSPEQREAIEEAKK